MEIWSDLMERNTTLQHKVILVSDVKSLMGLPGSKLHSSVSESEWLQCVKQHSRLLYWNKYFVILQVSSAF